MEKKSFDGKAFGEQLLVAIKEYVERKIGALAQDVIAQGNRQTSADQLLADLDARLAALEQQREAAAAAPRLRQVS